MRVRSLSKRFGATAALTGVGLDAPPGEVHALLGGNGSGKSTLIKVLAGVHPGEPGGEIEVDGRRVATDRVTPGWSREAGLRFVHQDLGLFDVLTVAENLLSGARYPRARGRIAWARMERDAQAALDRLGIDVAAGRPLGALRPAEQTLVAIARALRDGEGRHDGVLVLDEPTARLPAEEVEPLLAAVRRYAAAGQTILYVSHRLEEVLSIADRVTVLRDGRVVGTQAAGALPKAELARMIVGRAVSTGAPRGADRPAGRTVLRLEGLRAGPLRDVSLEVREREVLGVAGLVGSGRTTLLKAIYGARPREAGTVTLDGEPLAGASVRDAIRRGLSFVPEDRAGEGAFLELAVPENLSAADPGRHRHGPWFGHRRERASAARALARFAIRAPEVGAPMTALSGGNQQKVVVARWLERAPRVLLLDEPTQGVDVGARADLHAQIRAAVDAGRAAILISSDIDELLELADRVVVLSDGRTAAEAPTAVIDRHWLAERLHLTGRAAA